MTPARLDECLALIGWSRLHLSRRLRIPPSTVHQMATGKRRIRPEEAEWIETLAACHAAHPPPARRDARLGMRGPADPARLEQLRGLLAEGLTFRQAAERMKENPKAVKSFGERHGLHARPKPA